VVLYIGIAAGWSVLAFVAFAICRVASLTEDVRSLELAEWIAGGGPRGSAQPVTDEAAAASLPGRRRASGATG
jgi:hypothetical protein